MNPFEVFGTIVATIIFIGITLFLRYFLRKRLSGEQNRVLYVVLVILTTVYVSYLAYVWQLFQFLVGVLAAAGALGVLFAFSLLPWVTDIFSGISIILDPRINIGSEVEIDGKKGKIIGITLTRTIISGDECIILVPNKRFRESVVVVYSTKPREKFMK